MSVSLLTHKTIKARDIEAAGPQPRAGKGESWNSNLRPSSSKIQAPS